MMNSERCSKTAPHYSSFWKYLMQYLQKAQLQSADWGVCQHTAEGSKRDEVVRVKVRRARPAERRASGAEEPLTAQNTRFLAAAN